MSLYLKHRPKKLSEVVGNSDMLKSLTAVLDRGENRPHAYLLTGPTGCGKTTIGRIIAEHLRVNGSDFREVDSADFRGIDTIREMRSQSHYMALEGPNRMWLLDECHKMSNDAQNALLKALEDTPPHVYYVLCTTDPQKLLGTIKGRCSHFQVDRLSDIDMRKLLTRVSKAEGENLAADVRSIIIDSAQGHPRNALQLLDQVLSVEPDLRAEIARKAQEATSQGIDLCRALIGGEPWKKVAGILSDLKTQKKEAEEVRRMVMGYASAILLKGGENEAAANVLEEFRDPMWDVGFPGVVLACYGVLFRKE